MTKLILSYISQLLHTAFSLYFQHESEYSSLRDIPLDSDELSRLTGRELTWEETIILLLATTPHIHPQALDLFFIQNKELDRPYTEFGGWKGISHGGFLPTGESAAFLLSIDHSESRALAIRLFSRSHWFYTENILRLEGQGAGEPFLSGRLTISEEFLAKVLGNESYRPDYSDDFPAKRMQTELEWEDLVVAHHLREDLESISLWLQNEKDIRSRWGLNKYIKPGYRCLFYGPPGTGKTLAASLLGKKHGMDVYRVDLSMIVSKYIGETEKNLAKIFDRAEHQNWILFFDEADALFGQRSEGNSSNDRHANQEVAYLLQRIEDFPGMVVLATNLKDNMDEAFFRRFQSVLYFPMPEKQARKQLWKQMLPSEWLRSDEQEILAFAAEAELSGGSMINVVQRCALMLYTLETPLLTKDLFQIAMDKELEKEGTIR
ncbi:ATPase family associated with various cellular activities (AAA) [Sphingobacterium nematocida]|uniref:ATPase family associated with various cellular activities (AAA) n=1 Tax=Sphingobacterium nematocida TaxID=1513896 RepID=A0A1T5EFX8_9SPHI|nr:ATP-binding protein [Sphingobacterium nematocida]SKB82791.1 ATPase family associated with various cellular activities (AAA) [Sphingobacterium nematocida]